MDSFTAGGSVDDVDSQTIKDKWVWRKKKYSNVFFVLNSIITLM